MQAQLTDALVELVDDGGYRGALVVTDQGLLVASAGQLPAEEALAGFTSLFDEIVARGERDLGLAAIDEVTLLDRQHGRLVVRPLGRSTERRMFLVVSLDANATWRRNTQKLAQRIGPTLADIMNAAEGASSL